MKPVRVRVSDPAFTDLAEIIDYIAQRSPKNADSVEGAFYRVLDGLAVTPTIGHIHAEINDDSVRFVPFKSFEVAYRYEAGVVDVIRVIYAARDFAKFDWR